jgi:hypothetical protein
VDACISQLHNASSLMPRIYIHCTDYYVLYSRLENRVGAWAGKADSGTRLQSNVKRGRSGHGAAEITEAFDFSMFASCSSVMSFCDYPIVQY